MGLKYDLKLVEDLLKGIIGMFDLRDSSVIQKYLKEGEDKGRQEGAVDQFRKNILGLVARRFGIVSPQLRVRIESESDLERLEILFDKAIDVDSPEKMMFD